MKLSVLIPSLCKPLLERMLNSLYRNDVPKGVDIEIVIHSPWPYSGMHIKHVPDTEGGGSNPAIRRAFKASAGDVILVLPDDWTVNPELIKLGLSTLNKSPETIVATEGGMFTVFNHRYALCPMTLRKTVDKHWDFFFPYTQHWGDPAFSLDVWRKGGQVLQMPSSANWGLPRLGCVEAPTKESHFAADNERFLKDFHEFTYGWDLSDWHNYNHP